jgi:hypothetical protein
MDWTAGGVIGVISLLIGIYISITAPIIKLNKNLTELNCNFKTLQETQVSNKSDNAEEHKEIWAKSEEHDKALAEHDKRLTIVEQKGNK